ncbi:MAG: AMP-dependent synthetase/ligase [Calditrichia bacterium]
MGYASLAEMFFKSCDKYADKVGMKHKDEKGWNDILFKDMKTQVVDLANGFASLGIEKGEKVNILSHNSYLWAFADYAIIANGGVSVAIYPTLLPSQISYIINDCGSRFIIVENKEQYDKLMAIKDSITGLQKIIMIDPTDVSGDNVTSIADLIEQGKTYGAANPGELSTRWQALTRDDLSIFIYTSGTTGEPKGVMLTHGNLLSNIEGGLSALSVDESDTMLSFLPLSHIFERMTGHFLANHAGVTIAYAESIEKLTDNLGEIRPTIMASVPRIFEKIYAKVLDGVESGSPLKKKIFNWAVGVGRESLEYRQQNKPLPGLLGIKAGLAHKLVFSKLIDRVGGKIRFFVSGGAPLSREIGVFFAAAGLTILEGYGLSETSPVISVNRLEKYKFGSVGVPLHNVEAKIAADGEILTRGPHVMAGYFNKPEATKEAIDSEGWFHTGDIGHFDDDGMLIITDRKKNIIVTAGGKNVAPQRVEGMLVTSRYVEQSLVIGDKRKFCSAVIVPDFEALEKFAKEKNISYGDHEELVNNPDVLKLVQGEVANVNKDCASFESIKKFVLISRPFSIESGELTPSLKVKRKEVEKNYADQIESLYS